MWRHDIIKDQQVRIHQANQNDTTKLHMYILSILSCLCLVFNFHFGLVLISNGVVDI